MLRIFSVLISGFIFVCQGCSYVQPKYHPGGPYYYKSWASYKLPYRPIDEISYKEAKQIEASGYAYYEAFFNEDGFIITFKKYYHEKLDFAVSYYYEKGILVKSEGIDFEGKKQILYFDKKGKIIKQ